MLEGRGWIVHIMHANMLQSGLPDLFCHHRNYGQRWIEVKLPDMKGSKFTERQHIVMPEMVNNGCPIWILTGATDSEYKKLFVPHNFNLMYLLKFKGRK